MASIVVCGGSAIGLCTAMLLAADGHDVTVLDSDPTAPPPPAAAWEGWHRPGVAQFRQPHNLFARFREISDAELPGLTDRLLAAGCVWVDYLATKPPGLTDSEPRPGDDRLLFVTGRRPTVEAVLATMALGRPGIEVRRGVTVAGLVAGSPAAPGIPHVVGVRTTGGESITADLVVDATGRRSPAAAWLAALGGQPFVEDASVGGFAYYTRYFTGPSRPQRIGPAVVAYGTYSLLTLDGDNDTWSVTLFARTKDKPLKQFRNCDAFSRVVRACPMQAHFLDGTPISDVLVMAGVLDRTRTFVLDDAPVVTGFAAVGDAWACTNPSAGRGISVGLVHAQVLRDTVRTHLDRPAEFARAFHDATDRLVAPFVRNQIANDRIRIAEMEAIENGTPLPPLDPLMGRLMIAARTDPAIFRALLETVLCLALPQEVAERPYAKSVLDNAPDPVRPPPPPGPDRAQLLALLAQ